VYYYFRKWTAYGVLEEIVYQVVRKFRTEQGRSAEPSAAVIDTQSVKNEARVNKQTGHNAGKKVIGRKQNVVTDTQGIPVGVSGAGKHDKQAIKSLQEQIEDYMESK